MTPINLNSPLIRKLENSKAEKKFSLPQDFVDDVLVFGFGNSSDIGLISSSLEIITIDEMKNKGWEPRYKSFSNRNIDIETIHLINSEIENLPKVLFGSINRYIKKYIFLPAESQYNLLSTWVIATYYFQIFQRFPYIHVIAEKGSGKTTLMEVLQPIVFNGDLSISATSAVVFRDVAYNTPTILIDEVENLLHSRNNKASEDLLQVLRKGYSKNGTVKRMEKELTGINEYPCYSPKIFASINKLEDALESRCIIMKLKKVEEDFQIKKYYPTKNLMDEQKNIRDMSYKFALEHSAQIFLSTTQIASDSSELEFHGRAFDLILPLFVTARLIDASMSEDEDILTSDIINFFDEMETNDPLTGFVEFDQLLLISSLEKLVETVPADRSSGEKMFYSNEKLWDYFCNENSIHFSSKKSLTKALKAIGISTLSSRVSNVPKRGVIASMEIVEALRAKYQ